MANGGRPMHAEGLQKTRRRGFARVAVWHYLQCAVDEQDGEQRLAYGYGITRAPAGDFETEFNTREGWGRHFLDLPIHTGRGAVAVVASEWDAGPAAHVGALETLLGAGYRLREGAALDGGLPWWAEFLREGRRTIILTDIHNYHRSPLRDLAREFGAFDRPGPARVRLQDGRGMDLCRGDCETMRRAMESMLSYTGAEGLGGLPRSQSAAAAAVAALPRHVAPVAERISWTRDTRILRAQRAYPAGGRLIVGPALPAEGEPVWCYDRHSAYPAIAAAVPLPVAGAEWQQRRVDGPAGLAEHLERPGWHFARVRVQVPAGARLLDGGTYGVSLCGPELRLAVERGWVRGCEIVRTMRTLGRPWRSFILEMYRRKATAQTPVGRYFAKLLLNSLLGRTAGRGGQWGDMPEDMIEEALLDTERLEDEGAFDEPIMVSLREHRDTEARHLAGRWSYRLPERRESYYSQPAYWAALTGVQRADMGLAAEGIEQAGGHVYYGDTDSLYVDAVGRDWIEQNLPVGEGLGDWQADHRGPDHYPIFRGARSYRWHNETIQSGVRLDGDSSVKAGYIQQYHRRGVVPDKITVSAPRLASDVFTAHP